MKYQRLENPTDDGGVSNKWSHYLFQWYPRSRVIVCLVCITIIPSLFYMNSITDSRFMELSVVEDIENGSTHSLNNEDVNNYIVWNPHCRIPDFKVISDDIKHLLKPNKYKSCSKHDPLTYVEIRNETAILLVDKNMIDVYAKNKNLTCCYSTVTRKPSKKTPDDSIDITKCNIFKNEVTLNKSVEFIISKCSIMQNKKKKNVYSNGHTIVPLKPDVKKRLEIFKKNDTSEPLSVLIVGIDSISRLNLYRSMPKTAAYLKTRGWIELRGYNKMGDNTFPNLMAILTGFNNSRSYSQCNPKKHMQLDKCPLLWYKYRNVGYATAYAEDEVAISTFNFQKVGFTNAPTDYYYRPFVIATEKELSIERLNGLKYCIGPVPAGERILEYAYQFTETFKNNPYFGFFWMNSFSHNDLNSPSGMDLKVKQWFDKMEGTGVFNTSMVIFLSDHGLRFGKILETMSGWLEERLPFIQIWLPNWFKNKYPLAMNNLLINSIRLTTPYDLHMTLQDVLLLSGRIEQITPSAACPKCKSLFEEASMDRSCADAAIDPHWCTCNRFVETSKDNPIVSAGAEAIIAEIQHVLNSYNSSKQLCAKLKLNKIIDARITPYASSDDTYYLLLIQTMPGKGKFQATLNYKSENSKHIFDIQGTISRVDMYSKQSSCIDDAHLKKYCYCH